MRTVVALLIVLMSAASVAGCGQPVSVGTDSTSTVTEPASSSAPIASAPTAPAAADPGTTAGTTGGTTGSTPTTGLCGTTATSITYSKQAQAVIQANCTLCHNATSPLMTDYDSSRAGFEQGGLVAVQNGVMPISITLSDNDKCILTQWANNKYAK